MSQSHLEAELAAAAAAHDGGQLDSALRHYRRAAVVAPALLLVVGSIGLVLVEMQADKAELWCRCAVSLDPYSVGALHNLALATRHVGPGRSLRRLLSLDPSHGEGGRLLSTVEVARGSLYAGARRLSRVRGAMPLSVAVLVDTGKNARRLCRHRDAEAAFRSALALAPSNVGVLNAIGTDAQTGTAVERAVIFYRRGLAREGRHPALWSNIGRAFLKQGKVEPAAISFRQAAAQEPSGADALAGLAFVEGVMRRENQSLDLCRRAMLLAPTAVAPRVLHASIERTRGRLSFATTQCRQALAYQPDDAGAHMTLGAACQDMRKVRGAVSAYGRALACQPGYADAERNLLYALLHLPEVTEEEVFRSTVVFARRHQPPEDRRLPAPTNDPDANRPLRIGYVTSDFREHPNRWFMNALFEHRNMRTTTVICYSASHLKDRETEWVAVSVDAWRDVVEMDDETLAKAIRADAIDIAVFIGGRFDGNRPLVAAYRPAPVQISFLDGGTSAVRHMDYWITDGVLHPEGRTAELFTEELFRLPVFYSFTRPMPTMPTVPPPVQREGRITFGSFTQPARITDEVVSVWAEILGAVPESRLLLKSRNRYGDEANRRALARGFGERGIDPERVMLETTMDSHAAHLSQYEKVDIVLDTFPFSAATTNFEALWMGVPIVTLPGTRFVARMGAAILSAVDLKELIATDRTNYVEIAIRLAKNPDGLAHLRQGLRQRVAASALCDGPAFARSVETAYRTMWRRWCRQQAVDAPEGSQS